MPLPTPVTIEELKAFDKAKEEHHSKCRFHPILKVLQNAISSGLLPIQEMKSDEGVFWHRGNGFFSFDNMYVRDFGPADEQAVIIRAKISACNEERNGREVSTWFYLPIPLFRTDLKITDKDFLAWCKARRQYRADRIRDEENQRKQKIADAEVLVNKPVALPGYSPDY